MLCFLACLILLSTYSMEDDELFTTKLGHRWFAFMLMVIKAHLWVRGSSWKLTSLNIIGIIAAFYADTSEPHLAALGLLLQSSISLAAIIMSFNRSKHVRSLWQPFTGRPSEEEHVNNADWEDLPVLAPNLLEDVEILSSDDSSDEDHLPPGFLDGPFILGHSPPIAG